MNAAAGVGDAFGEDEAADGDSEVEGDGWRVMRWTAAAGLGAGPGLALCRLVAARAVPPAATARTIAAAASARRCLRC